MLDSFGVIWENQGKSKKQKKRDSKELGQLYREQQEELDEMLAEGYSTKDLNAKIYKLKQMITGPKIKTAEPMCIKDPVTGELITDYDSIKKITLEHTTKILSKNPLRVQDRKEHEDKARNHKRIMENKNTEEWKLSSVIFEKVLKRIRDKRKKMFDPLNKAGNLFKKAVMKYMSKIIDTETTTFQN